MHSEPRGRSKLVESEEGVAVRWSVTSLTNSSGGLVASHLSPSRGQKVKCVDEAGTVAFSAVRTAHADTS